MLTPSPPPGRKDWAPRPSICPSTPSQTWALTAPTAPATFLALMELFHGGGVAHIPTDYQGLSICLGNGPSDHSSPAVSGSAGSSIWLFHFQASLHTNYYSLISLTSVKHFDKVTSHSACFGKVLMNPKSLKVLKHEQATPGKNHKSSPPSDCRSLSADISCCYSRPIWHYTSRHHCSQTSISPVAIKANSPRCELHKWSSWHLAG